MFVVIFASETSDLSKKWVSGMAPTTLTGVSRVKEKVDTFYNFEGRF